MRTSESRIDKMLPFLLPENETKDVGSMESWEWLSPLQTESNNVFTRVEKGNEDEGT